MVEPKGSRLAAPRSGCRTLGLRAADETAASSCWCLGLHHVGGRARVLGHRTTANAWFWSGHPSLQAELWTGHTGVAARLLHRCMGAQPKLLGPPSLVLQGLVI